MIHSKKMSLIDSAEIPNLFLNNNISDNFFLPKDIGDNLNDILDKSKNDIIPSKQIKFVLTKESPSINLLQKKTFVKVNKSKILWSKNGFKQTPRPYDNSSDKRL